MALKELIRRAFGRKEAEVYTPQREAIDRQHDSLQRELSKLQKKKEIPEMRRRIKELSKEVYGTTFDRNPMGNKTSVFEDIEHPQQRATRPTIDRKGIVRMNIEFKAMEEARKREAIERKQDKQFKKDVEKLAKDKKKKFDERRKRSVIAIAVLVDIPL